VCFGLGWIEQFLVWLVVICMVIALLRLLVAFVVPRLGLSAEIVTFVVKAITIVIWAIILIACIYFIFDLIACFAPSMRLSGVR
jgi:hypothetical protein